MRKRFLCLAVMGANLIVNGKASDGGPGNPALTYPKAPRANTVDNYHGVPVEDAFRPLEDPDAPSTRAWIDAQNKLTFSFLEQIPERAAIERRLTELWDYEKYDVPTHEGGRYFYNYNTGLQNQSVLYTTESLDAKARVLIDPNTLSADGTVALAGTAVSKDGKRIAYGIAAAGSDWSRWKVRDVDTGQDLPDEVNWIKFSAAEWSPDGAGFFYGRFPQPEPGDDLKGANYFQKVYYHRLGTKQSDDRLVWEDPEHKEWRADPMVTDDGKFLILTIGKGTDSKYRILYRPLDRPDQKPIHLVGDFDADFTFIDNDGPVLWFKTDDNAPRGRVIAIDTGKKSARIGSSLSRSQPTPWSMSTSSGTTSSQHI